MTLISNSPTLLPFSIANILRPDFPKEEKIDLAIDLSRTTKTPPGMVAGPNGDLIPAWVFCTRYTDRPSGGRGTRRQGQRTRKQTEDKKPRRTFTREQLDRLKKEFQISQYLTEERRNTICPELGLSEDQLKIWFQNMRAKVKKASQKKNDLALALARQGIYNH